MGRSDRKMHKALDELERRYAAAWQVHRVGMSHRRALLDDPATTATVRAEVLFDLAVLHRAAVRDGLDAAERVGAPGWLGRAGHDEAWAHEHLWQVHGEPLTGITWSQLSGIDTASPW